MGGKSDGTIVANPIVADETERTVSSVTLVDVISEGPILGLVNLGQSIYLNNVQLQQPSGQFNMFGVAVHVRYGTPVQDPLPYRWIEQTFDVNQEVKSAYNHVAIPDPGHLNATVDTAQGLLISNNCATDADIGAPTVRNPIKLGDPGVGVKQTAVPTASPIGGFRWNAGLSKWDPYVVNAGSNVIGDGNSTRYRTYYYDGGGLAGPIAEIEGGVVRTVNNPNAKAIRMIIKIDKLYQESGNGDVSPATVRFAVQYKRKSDTFWSFAGSPSYQWTQFTPCVVYGQFGHTILGVQIGRNAGRLKVDVVIRVAARARYNVHFQFGNAAIGMFPTSWTTFDYSNAIPGWYSSQSGFNGSDSPQIMRFTLYADPELNQFIDWDVYRVFDDYGNQILETTYYTQPAGVNFTTEGGTAITNFPGLGVIAITAKVQNGIQVDYVMEIPQRANTGNSNNLEQVDIRVLKLVPDDVYVGIDAPSYFTAVGIPTDFAVYRANSWLTYCSITWAAYVELVDNTIQYSDTAVVGMDFNSQWTGQSIPARAYDVYGRIIRVPANYDAFTHVYTGLWDGTFIQSWTNNPVWIFLDLLTHTRYGLGQWITDDLVDFAALYQVAKYCDDPVTTDGDIDPSPRFTFNTQIVTQDQAYNVLAMMSSVFRGMVYWAAGGITITQDSPKDPTRIVTPANVINGDFQYVGSALQARHSVVIVQWSDPDNFGKDRNDVWEDPSLISRYGYVTTEMKAWGCTSYSQAMRMARWLLETEKHATEVVTYRAGFDHADARPGEVIAIADPTISGMRHGGRIVKGTTVQLFMDSEFAFQVGETYTITVQIPTWGRVSVVKGSTAVTGNRTSFTAITGNTIVFPGDKKFYRYTTVSNTSIILDDPYEGASIVDSEFTIFDFSIFVGNLTLVVTSQIPVVEVGVTNPGGTTSQIDLSTPLPMAPQENASFVLTGQSVEPRLFTIIGNKEIDAHTYEISALAYDPTKFDRVEA